LAKSKPLKRLPPVGYANDSQVRQIDVYFNPNPPKPPLPNLGLLHKLAATSATFEPFRKAVTIGEICSCIAKLFDLHGELTRQAKRDGDIKLAIAELPHLFSPVNALSKRSFSNARLTLSIFCYRSSDITNLAYKATSLM
jgi:hypothetical protein